MRPGRTRMPAAHCPVQSLVLCTRCRVRPPADVDGLFPDRGRGLHFPKCVGGPGPRKASHQTRGRGGPLALDWTRAGTGMHACNHSGAGGAWFAWRHTVLPTANSPPPPLPPPDGSLDSATPANGYSGTGHNVQWVEDSVFTSVLQCSAVRPGGDGGLGACVQTPVSLDGRLNWSTVDVPSPHTTP